ncbi:MAG: ABC transporter permease [Armatimonadota bacterium]|nr:ABC transporter permease [Armatimonadota bacterium]MDR7518573.1 ABC transporter permease [Armatimonadota bacterium]MDR7551167.1 ABC transporter permease [Armatimonadota bacterium]
MRAVVLARRVLTTIPIMFGVAVIVFVVMRMLPGDPVDIILGQAGAASQQDLNRLRQDFYLDRPLGEQLLRFIAGAARGDLGMSFARRRPVFAMLVEALPATVELALAATLIALAVAIPVGVLSAVYQRSWLDRLAMGGAFLGISMPAFWLGIVAIMVFAVQLGWFPTSGRLSHEVLLAPTTGFVLVDSVLARNWAALADGLRHLVLPAAVLGAGLLAIVARVMRSSMLEVLREQYVTTARSKGLAGRLVIWRHAMRNALIPTVTVVGLQLGVLLGGNMIVETVFGWPGMGRLVVEAIFNRDYPVVQGAVMLYAMTFVLANLAVDLCYIYLDPRIAL